MHEKKNRHPHRFAPFRTNSCPTQPPPIPVHATPYAASRPAPELQHRTPRVPRNETHLRSRRRRGAPNAGDTPPVLLAGDPQGRAREHSGDVRAEHKRKQGGEKQRPLHVCGRGGGMFWAVVDGFDAVQVFFSEPKQNVLGGYRVEERQTKAEKLLAMESFMMVGKACSLALHVRAATARWSRVACTP